MIFYNLLISSTLITISSYSWVCSWMGLEMNLLSLIPLMKMFKNKLSAEATIKYFIIQAMASSMFLFSLIFFNFNKLFLNNMMMTSLFMNSALFMKMGAAPFHFWLPEVSSGMNWEINFIILTWQKFAPSILIFYSMHTYIFFSIIIIISSLISGIQSLNQTCLRKILAYSSINHISWMISAILNSLNIWMYYFLIYSLINFNIMLMFSHFNIFNIYQMSKLFSSNKMMKIFFMCNFLSLGGLPPFLGFFPKWMVINQMISNNLYMLSFLMMMFTLVSLYIYMRLTFSSFSLSKKKSLIFFFNNMYFYMFFLNFLNLFSLTICMIPSKFS
uniref:NADH-ubiquinone oxidoreductase chain 2 n=1 Tax=Curculionoidea sp. 18 KM-2017 TaxID=2219401 RepID=A0A346RGN3_9CUCU|nr:NADH dehydrogenase subunit 2 [Curculionoidea sp. 18 KM-2017]